MKSSRTTKATSDSNRVKLDEAYNIATSHKYARSKLVKPKSSISFVTIVALAFFLLFGVYLGIRSSPKPAPIATFNFSQPLSKFQLSEFILSTDQHLDFPLILFQHQDYNLPHKMQTVKKQVHELIVDHRYILPKHGLIKETNLLVLEHKRFTSCRQASILNFFSQLIGLGGCFSGAKRVTEFDNTQVWSSSGNRITFYAKQPIRPFYFAIKVPQEKLNNKVQIFGFRIESDTIAAAKMLSSYHLGIYQLDAQLQEEDGKMYLPCQNKECSNSYLYVMLMMEQLELVEFNIYVDQ